MNWDAIAAIAETVGATGVILTLGYLAAQVRHNTRAVQAATYDSIVAQFRDWNAPFRSSPELTTQFIRQLEQIDSLDREEKQHAVHIFYDFFKLAENLHYQHRMGMIEDSLWDGWAALFGQYLTAPGTAWYWQRRRSFYAKEFAEWIDVLLEKDHPPHRAAQIANES